MKARNRSLARRLAAGAMLGSLLLTGCQALSGSHEPGMYHPTAARDEAIRKKAEKDPFVPEGQPLTDAVVDTPSAVQRVR